MKSSDRFLIAIVVGVLLLVAISIAVVLTRPEAEYKAEDSPEGVAHNYLLALQQEDYDRAYGYLSTRLPGYPVSTARFAETVEDNSWRFRLNRDSSLAVIDTQLDGDEAAVTVRETYFYGGGLFESGQRMNTFDMDLQLERGDWRITHAYYYFAPCWEHDDGCR